MIMLEQHSEYRKTTFMLIKCDSKCVYKQFVNNNTANSKGTGSRSNLVQILF